jgi:hypothetical protein
MLRSLDREIAHLSLDHTWVAPVPAFRIEFLDHLGKQHPIVIVIVGEGEKTPVSRLGTG